MISLEYYTLIIYLLLLAVACYTTTQEIGLKKNTQYHINIKMNTLKGINIKTSTCYYCNYIIKIESFDFGNISLDQKSYENILVCDVSYRTLINAKPLLIRLNKVDEFNRVIWFWKI